MRKQLPAQILPGILSSALSPSFAFVVSLRSLPLSTNVVELRRIQHPHSTSVLCVGLRDWRHWHAPV